MILLDTSFLIRALVRGADEAESIRLWRERGDSLCTSAVVWYEFLCGPVDDEAADLARALVDDRVIPFGADQAAEAARLFEATGRPRRLRVDSMVAAAAIVANAALATGNPDDFRPFVAQGLTLLRG